MSPGLADVPQSANPLATSPKNTFDREPLLIPLVPTSGKPWYKRRAAWVKIILSAVAMLLVAYVVHRYTAVGLLKKFAKIAGR